MSFALRRIVLAAACTGLLAAAAQASDDRGGDRGQADAATANLSLGTAYLRNGNLAVAKDKLERARDQNPRDVQVLTVLALLYERINDLGKAESSYRTALRLQPANPEVHNNYAVYACRHGHVSEALKHFDLAANNRLYTTPWAAYTNAGVCLRSAKRDSDAEQLFGQALGSNPVYAEAVLQQATLEFDTQRVAAAWQRLALYLNRNPANPELLYLGWRVASAGKDPGNAERMAARLQKEFPDSAQAKQLADAATTARSG